MTNHTPTPWYIDAEWGFYCPNENHDAQDVDKKVFEAGTKEDAAFIVRAVNAYERLSKSHEGLLTACREVLAGWDNPAIPKTTILKKAIAKAEGVKL